MEFPRKIRGRVIIATKGLPFTGREQLSIRLAKWAKCPILSLYGVLNALSKEKGYTSSSETKPSEAEAKSLERQAFSILCNLAKVYLRCSNVENSMKCVVIDSPLSSTCQLDQLLEVIENSWMIRYKLIIVECRVKNEHTCRLRFKQPGQYDRICQVFFQLCGSDEGGVEWTWMSLLDDDEATGEYQEFAELFQLAGSKQRNGERMPPLWFLPKCWEDAERAIQAYDARTWDDHFHSRCANSRHVRRIVLDPELDVRYGELEEEGRTSPFAEALSCIIHNEEVPYGCVIELDQWSIFTERLAHLRLFPNEKSTLCKNGECSFTCKDYLEDDATCMACDQKLFQQAYACRFCTLTLHKSCAEIYPYKPKYLYQDDACGETMRYRISLLGCVPQLIIMCRFPETHACDSCKSYSDNCTSCVLKTHLKCRLMPTIIKEDNCHNHLLFIQMATDPTREHGAYSCSACGEGGNFCSYFCIICRFNYHVRCAVSPRELEHQHGGYNHLMKLKSSREEEEEDYWCDVCCKDMDPECWYYSCQTCPYYVTHMHCAFVKRAHRIYLPGRLRFWARTPISWSFL